MDSSIKIFLTRLYMTLRGRGRVDSSVTNDTFTYSYEFETEKKQKVKLLLLSERYRHLSIMERWYIPNRVYHTYRVQVIMITGLLTEKTLPVQQFPLLCSRIFVGTKYPHIQATNAYIDNLIHHFHTNNDEYA